MALRTPLDIALFEARRTNRSLAKQLGVHESQVSRWRSGMHVPEVATQKRIARALGRTAEELWPDQEPPGAKAAA